MTEFDDVIQDEFELASDVDLEEVDGGEDSQEESSEKKPKKERKREVKTTFSKRIYESDKEVLLDLYERRKKELSESGLDSDDTEITRSFLPGIIGTFRDMPVTGIYSYVNTLEVIAREITRQARAANNAHNEAIKARDVYWQDEVDKMREIIDKREETIKSLRGDLKAAKDEAEQLAELPKQLETKEEAIAALKGQLENQAVAKDAEINKLQGIIDGHDDAEAQLAEALKANKELQGQVDNLSTKIAVKEQEIAVAAAELKSANNNIDDLKDRVKSAEERVEKATAAAAARIEKAEKDAKERVEAAEEREKTAKEEGARREEAARKDADKLVDAARAEAAAHAEQIAANVAKAHEAEIDRLSLEHKNNLAALREEYNRNLEELERELDGARVQIAELTAKQQ